MRLPHHRGRQGALQRQRGMRPVRDGLAVPRGVRLSPVIGLIIIIMRPAAAAGRPDFS